MFATVIKLTAFLQEYFSKLEIVVPTKYFSSIALFSSIFILTVALSFYIFKSVSLYVFAKNNGIDKAWISFVPFANYYIVGKLAGRVRMFSMTFKNIGIYVAVFFFLYFTVNTFLDAYVYFDEFRLLVENGVIAKITLSDYTLYNALKAVNYVFSFAVIAFLVWLNMALIGKFDRNHLILYSILIVIGLISEPIWLTYNVMYAIVIFAMRKRRALTVSDYIRMREEYLKNRGVNVQEFKVNQNQSEDEPFSEYSDDKSNLNQDVFSDFKPGSTENKNNLDDGSDDFFN